jgi:hypothetical protein
MADELYQSELEATLAAWEAESKLKIAKLQAKQQQEYEALQQRGTKVRASGRAGGAPGPVQCERPPPSASRCCTHPVPAPQLSAWHLLVPLHGAVDTGCACRQALRCWCWPASMPLIEFMGILAPAAPRQLHLCILGSGPAWL